MKENPVCFIILGFQSTQNEQNKEGYTTIIFTISLEVLQSLPR